MGKAFKVIKEDGLVLNQPDKISFVAGALAFDPGTKSSMLVDLENGRPTEVEALHGTLIRLAEKHGLAVPVTRAIYAQIIGLRVAYEDHPCRLVGGLRLDSEAGFLTNGLYYVKMRV